MQRMTPHKNSTRSYQRANELRKQSPLAERILWHHLQTNRGACGFKFRRQYPLEPYIVDFVCLKAKLVIELDGMSHDTRQKYDAARDAYLTKCGYEVVRYANDLVIKTAHDVVVDILHRTSLRLALLQKTGGCGLPPPLTPPAGGGEPPC